MPVKLHHLSLVLGSKKIALHTKIAWVLQCEFFLCFLLRGLAGLHCILQKNIWEESEVARSLHVFACSFHAVSPRPGLVKLLVPSNFQARRRSLRDSSFTGHFGQFFVLRSVIFIDIYVIGVSLPTIGCALLSQVSRTQWLLCADPAPFLVHRRWLDSGMVFSSLTHSTSEDNLCWICLINSLLVWPLKMNVFVFLTTLDLSVSCRISWLKGERPGTRTLAAHRQKKRFSNVDSAAGFLLDRSLKGQGIECGPPPS